MAAKLVFFVALVAHFKEVVSTTCGQEIENFRSCMLEFREQNRRVEPTEDQIRNRLEKCFENARCSNPFQESTIIPHHTVLNQRRQMKTMRSCVKDVMKTELRPMLESCLAEKIEGFTFPVHDDEVHEEHKNRTALFRTAKSQVNEVCPKKKMRKRAKRCLSRAREELLVSIQERKDRRKLKKENKERCLQKMSADCQDKYNQKRKFQCQCANQEINDDKKEQLRVKVEACVLDVVGQAHLNVSVVDQIRYSGTKIVKKLCRQQKTARKDKRKKKHRKNKDRRKHSKIRELDSDDDA